MSYAEYGRTLPHQYPPPPPPGERLKQIMGEERFNDAMYKIQSGLEKRL